jgi:AraC family transcriptional regulator
MEAGLSRKRVSLATGLVEVPSIARPALSSGDTWKGMRLDQVTLPPAEEQEGYFPYHALVLYDGPPLELETASPGENLRVSEVRRGAVTIVPAGVAYRARWAAPIEMTVVRLSPGGPDSLMPETQRGLVRLVVGAEDELVRELVLALRAEAKKGAAGSELYAEAMGSALAAHLFHRYGTPLPPQKGGLPRRRVQELTDYVKAHLAGSLHLPELAGLTGLSVRQFARAFKESTSLTPHRFVLHCRIERAKLLLATTNLPVRAIAAACGFISQSRFTAAFRRLTRGTPSEYRTTRG